MVPQASRECSASLFMCNGKYIGVLCISLSDSLPDILEISSDIEVQTPPIFYKSVHTFNVFVVMAQKRYLY